MRMAEDITTIADDPRYVAVVARRSRLGWTLAGIMLVAYVAFLLVIAFDKALLAQPIAGGATSLGIPVGVGLILLAIVLTGVYVRAANRDFDPAMNALLAEYRG
jgi:uncharacterized membrane protein (DUF485 family)